MVLFKICFNIMNVIGMILINYLKIYLIFNFLFNNKFKFSQITIVLFQNNNKATYIVIINKIFKPFLFKISNSPLLLIKAKAKF